MTQRTSNRIVLMHHNSYIFSVISDAEDIEFEISGPDTLIVTKYLIDASECWENIKENDILEKWINKREEVREGLRGIMF